MFTIRTNSQVLYSRFLALSLGNWLTAEGISFVPDSVTSALWGSDDSFSFSFRLPLGAPLSFIDLDSMVFLLNEWIAFAAPCSFQPISRFEVFVGVDSGCLSISFLLTRVCGF